MILIELDSTPYPPAILCRYLLTVISKGLLGPYSYRDVSGLMMFCYNSLFIEVIRLSSHSLQADIAGSGCFGLNLPEGMTQGVCPRVPRTYLTPFIVVTKYYTLETGLFSGMSPLRPPLIPDLSWGDAM